MKKIISVLISAVICLTFSLTAFAGFGGNYVISKTDAVSVSDGIKMNEEIQEFEKETEVTPCIVFLDRLTQGTLQKEAEYYHKNYFDYENTFILIHDVNSGKTFVTAFGKYAQRIGEKAGVFELGEKMTQEKTFSKGYYEGALEYLDYIQMMVDAYGEDKVTQGVHNTTDAIGVFVNVAKWLIGPVVGALIVMTIYKTVVRNQYRNLKKTAMSQFENKKDTVFYNHRVVFVREYMRSDD